MTAVDKAGCLSAMGSSSGDVLGGVGGPEAYCTTVFRSQDFEESKNREEYAGRVRSQPDECRV